MKGSLLFLGITILGISSSLAISNPKCDCKSICNFTNLCNFVCNLDFPENSKKCKDLCLLAEEACEGNCISAGK